MTDSVTAYVGLGSNLGGPSRQIGLALDALGRATQVAVTGVSGLYRSAPLGGIEQPEFLNAAVRLETLLSASDLLGVLKGIEAELGRDRTERRWGPRSIDLDLLVYGSETIEEPGLTVPHSGIALRNFVLLPLRDLEPHLVIPGIGRLDELPVPDEPNIEKIGESI